MESSKDSSKELFLWQRALFLEGQTTRSRAESLRIRASQLYCSYQLNTA